MYITRVHATAITMWNVDRKNTSRFLGRHEKMREIKRLSKREVESIIKILIIWYIDFFPPSVVGNKEKKCCGFSRSFGL
jgi:hypothetical protein